MRKRHKDAHTLEKFPPCGETWSNKCDSRKKYRVSGLTCMRHCTGALIKHVLPRLLSPTGRLRYGRSDTALGESESHWWKSACDR